MMTNWRRCGRADTPEMAAAVAKLMSNKDLVVAASKIRVVTRCRNTMGERGVLGIRIQPNHPATTSAGSCSRPLMDCSMAAATRCSASTLPPIGRGLPSHPRMLDRLINALAIPPRPVAWHISRPNSLPRPAARPSTCSFSRSPEPRPPTELWHQPGAAPRGREPCSSIIAAATYYGSATRPCISRPGRGVRYPPVLITG